MRELTRRIWAHLPFVALLTVVPFLFYFPIFRMKTFGPEFALFFQYNDGYTFKQMLSQYLNLGTNWYRPTAFHLTYWIGQQFLSWYNTAGFQALEVATIVIAALIIYWFVLLLAPGARLAGALAAVFFALHPALYPSTIEAASFDFFHVFLTILCVGHFIRAVRSTGWKRLWALGLSCGFFGAALTAKELALATPGYLAVVILVLSIQEPGPESWLRRSLRRAYLLLPFFFGVAVYWRMHMRLVVGAFDSSGIYRTGFNLSAVLTNLHALPAWVFRVFYHTTPPTVQRFYHDDFVTNALAVVCLVFVAVAWWERARRSREDRTRLLLMLAWIGVFLVLPIYSGGFLWHIVLAMTGYAVLFGIGMATWIESAPRRLPRYAALAALLGSLALVSRINLNTEITGGAHSMTFYLNGSVREHPPVPKERLGPSPLVYVEDRLEMGDWAYGCFRFLFDYVYLRHDVEQVVVSRMKSVPSELRERWLAHPNAFFFRYDDEFHWFDDSANFRQGVFRDPPGMAKDKASILPKAQPPTALARAIGFFTGETQGSHGVQEAAATALALVLALCLARGCTGALREIERRASALAARRTLVILAIGLAPMLVRLAMLPNYAAAEPAVADEFSHLLVADTIAHGRLANPPHAFWRHFEENYVLQQPFYASIYPLAQGAFIALPKLVGLHPWLGIWLSDGLMLMAICWMLYQWFPPKWALIGGLIAALRLGVASQWMNSFWGGAAPALGGALVLGAAPRIVKRSRIQDSLVLALGVGILVGSRPYEGAMLTAAVLVWLVWRLGFAARLAPLAAVFLAIAAGTAYHNWRVTGSALTLPYLQNQKIYGTPQPFAFQRAVAAPPGAYRQRDLLDNFKWQLDAHDAVNTPLGFLESLAPKARSGWRFYLECSLTLPLLFIPWIIRDRRTRLLLIACATVFVAVSLYPLFLPHYLAPVACALFAIVVQGLRHMRAWRWRGAPAGAMLVWLLVCVRVAMAGVPSGLEHMRISGPGNTTREMVLDKLRSLGGKHLVFVRYGAKHSFHEGVIYNDADIDASRVVWARELDPASDAALRRYYPDRSAWLFEPDLTPPRLLPR